MRVARSLVAITAAVVSTAALTFVAPSAANADDALDTADVAAALAGVSDWLAAPVSSTSDTDSIADNGTVDVRRDGTIHFRTENTGDIVITLPYATKAEATNSGATYRSANSATVTRLVGMGAQTLLVAANEAAPTEYPFQVANGYVSNSSADGLILLDRNGSPVIPIPNPWAEDASGNTVKTKFVVSADQTSFTQIVEHHDGVNYPVVVDPLYYWYSAGLKIVLGINATATLGASAIFLPVITGLSSIGAIVVLRDKLLWNAGWLSIQSAWLRTQNQCLWIWVPYTGGIESGGYPC